MRIKKNIATSESGFLFNPTTGDSFLANSTAADVILLSKEGKTVEQIKTIILDKYDVDGVQFTRDLDDLVAQLRDNNLLDL